MADKKQMRDKFMKDFDSLDMVMRDHKLILECLQKRVDNFIQSELVEADAKPTIPITHPGYDAPACAASSTNLPPAMEAVMTLFAAELDASRKRLAGQEAVMRTFAARLTMAFDSCQTCEYCERLFDMAKLRHLDPPNDHIAICESCFDENFFDCHKCRRILPASERGEEDGDAGYGWICKECCKPVGFPPEVVIAPEWDGCEYVAAASLDALQNYADKQPGMFYPLEQDCLWLTLVKKDDNRAIYKTEKGVFYEIGELDYRGIGSMQELEGNPDA